MGAILAACGTSASDESASTPSGGAIKRGGTLRLGVLGAGAGRRSRDDVQRGRDRDRRHRARVPLLPRPRPPCSSRSFATKWAPSADASTWDFTIRAGRAVARRNAVHGRRRRRELDRLTDPKSKSAALSQFAGCSRPGTSSARTTRPSRSTWTGSTPTSRTSSRRSPTTRSSRRRSYEIGTFTKGGNGTGAFILKSYQNGQQATYTKNTDYWDKGKPYLDGLVMKYFSDERPRGCGAPGGAIDAMVETPLPGMQAHFSDADITILENPSTRYPARCRCAPTRALLGQELRQAVAYGLNRPDLITGLFNGKAVLGNDHAFRPPSPTPVDRTSSPARPGHRQGERSCVQSRRALVDQTSGSTNEATSGSPTARRS